MKFTESLWLSAGSIYGKILEHPFIQGLTDGSLCVSPASSPARRRCKQSLFTRWDAPLRISGFHKPDFARLSLLLTLFEQAAEGYFHRSFSEW